MVHLHIQNLIYMYVHFYFQLSLTIKEVQLVLVNEVEGAHIPLMSIRSCATGKVFDWSAQVS